MRHLRNINFISYIIYFWVPFFHPFGERSRTFCGWLRKVKMILIQMVWPKNDL